MPELRRDPVVGRWVIISTERARRPSDFPPAPRRRKGGPCVFCGGQEHRTPGEVWALRPGRGEPNTPGWLLRVVPNKFPALRIEGELEAAGEGLYDRMNGVGAHEVVIESPDHEAVIYEAARYPVCPPVMRAVRIEDLPKAPLSGISTLVVLPRSPTTADMAMVKRLGIPDAYVVKKSERSTPAIPRTAQSERGPNTTPGDPEDDESTAVDPPTL